MTYPFPPFDARDVEAAELALRAAALRRDVAADEFFDAKTEWASLKPHTGLDLNERDCWCRLVVARDALIKGEDAVRDATWALSLAQKRAQA